MNKMAMWWKCLVVSGFVLSILAVAVSATPKQEKEVLTFGMFAGNQWDVPDDNCYKIIDEAIEEFEKEHPQVTIQYDSGILKEDYSEALSQKALKGKLPDVFMVLQEDFSTFSSIGILKNLEPLIEGDSSFNPDAYYPGCYKAGSFDGGQYALPYESVPTLMFVNKTLLQKEGIDMPGNQWSWDDFYDICQKVTKDTNGDGIIDQFGVYNYDWKDAVYSNGENLFNAEGTRCNLTEDSVKNAISFVKKIHELSKYHQPESFDFDLGNIAFRPMKFSEFRTYKAYPWRMNKYFDFQWDCIRLPSGPDGSNKTRVDHLLLGISNKTAHSKLAWEFLKKLAWEEETQKKIFRYSQGVSPLKSVTRSGETEKLLEESMGDDTVVKGKLLDGVMNHSMVTRKFRGYDTVLQFIDREIEDMIESDGNLDESILKLKNQVEELLNK